MGKSRDKIVTDGAVPYFLTCSVVNWIPAFSNPAIAQIILDSLHFLHTKKRMRLHAYVIMENHIHPVASAEDLAKEMGDFKSFTARKCVDWYEENKKLWMLKQLRFHKSAHKIEQDYQFWQEGFHPQWIQNESMLLNRLEYIHNNPVTRGFVDDAAHWRYSSYRNYMDLEAVLPIDVLP